MTQTSPETTIRTERPTSDDGEVASLEAGRLLLGRLVGRADAEAVAVGREAATRGDAPELARLLAQLVVAERLPLLPDEHGWLRLVLAAALPEALVQLVEPVEQLPVPAERCVPLSAVEDAADVVERARHLPGVVGVWCARTRPVWDAPWPTPRRFVVVETETAEAADEVEDALSSGPPTVADHLAVIGPEGPETPHVAAAQLDGTLVWAARPDPGLRVAEVFPDGVPDPADVPAPDGSDPHDLDEEGWESLIAYLTEAEVVLWADGRDRDVVTGEDDVVPVDLRSDGTWVWSDASVYYLVRHRMPLPADFLAHLREQDGPPPGLDGVAHHRVLDLLSG